MRAWFNMPTEEFVFQLRDIAIKARARPQVIDAIDAIWFAPDDNEIQARIDEAVEQAVSGESARQWEICFDALEAGLRDRRGNLKLGLDQAQFEAIMGLLTAVKPE